MNISIIGSGSWGIALACLLNKNKHKVKIWSRNNDEIYQINNLHKVERYLPEIIIPDEVIAYADIKEVIQDSQMVILAVPSTAIRECASMIKNHIENQIIVNVAKGIEESTLKRLSEVIKEEVGGKEVATLSGPSHAEEVSKFIPTVVAVASQNKEVRNVVADAFRNEFFRVYPNEDIIGVEVGGALKNVIALCAGISDGLGFGDNTKAGLATRGLAEITRLGMAMGGKQETFSGLTGLGDLFVTCASNHSRNHRAGELIGKGIPPEEAVKRVNMVVEGVNTAKAGKKLGIKYGVELPIINQACEVLFEGKSPREAVLDLMMRDKKEEVTPTR
jgi:glycerol-3-phosphate dehydrogenase (NAD(P)+)